MKTAPCKDCDKRYLGCHSDCDDYKAFQAYREKFNADRLASRRHNDMFYDPRVKGKMR